MKVNEASTEPQGSNDQPGSAGVLWETGAIKESLQGI